jgi:two-component system response regulator RegA
MLLVVKDAALRRRLASRFRSRGYDVEESAELPSRRSLRPGEVALVAVAASGESPDEVVRRLKKIDPHSVIVALTESGEVGIALEVLRAGASDYVSTAADLDEIAAVVSRARRRATAAHHLHHDMAPSLARVEWEHMLRVLSDCGGNVSKAARLLGLPRRSLQRKLAKNPPRR